MLLVEYPPISNRYLHNFSILIFSFYIYYNVYTFFFNEPPQVRITRAILMYKISLEFEHGFQQI